MATEEELRAHEYRRSLIRRQNYKKAQERRMAGDRAQARTLTDNWEAVKVWLRERNDRLR